MEKSIILPEAEWLAYEAKLKALEDIRDNKPFITIRAPFPHFGSVSAINPEDAMIKIGNALSDATKRLESSEAKLQLTELNLMREEQKTYAITHHWFWRLFFKTKTT